MNRSSVLACFASATCALSAMAGGVNILVLSTGDVGHDAHLQATLSSFGHTVTIGPDYTAFDGTYNMSNIDVVYFAANYNWSAGDMPMTGQDALINWVSAGGGLVTGEWTTWKAAGTFTLVNLTNIMAVTPSANYGFEATMTLTQVTADPVINAGLPSQFQFLVTNIGGGTNTVMLPKPGATVFYQSDALGGQPGLVGSDVGGGRVIHFSTVNGEDQLNDANFSRLFSNVMEWAAQAAGACYADCDTSTGQGVLDIFDFLCFGNRFAANDPYACDCDTSTGPGICDIFDFLCFGNAFSAGCP